MRLSMDEVRKQHDGVQKLYEQGLRGATVSVEQVLDLFDTIEALQQENEQLRALVARMREALKQIALYDEYMTGAHEVAKQALSDTPADYHNPADVEMLKKAREAIQKAYDNYELIREYEYDISSYLEEALAEIDKTISRRIGC
jgi:phage shock protein A